MPFPLAAVLIGAGIGAMAGGMSGDDGWDWNRALLGGVFGGATGGIGAAAMGGAAAGGAALGGAGAASGATSAGSVLAASGGSAIGGSTIGLVTPAVATGASSAAGLASTSAPGLAAMGTGWGSTAAATTPAGIGSLGSSLSTMHGAAPPLQSSYASTAGSQGLGYGAPQSSYATPKGKPFDYGQLGESVQSFSDIAGEAEQKEDFEPMPLPRENPRSQQEQTIARDLEESRQSIYGSVPGGTSSGLGGIATAAKGGIATRFGMMKTPSGSLTGGEIVGPGTGTSDTIRSGIYPDIASKLGASSSNIGQGHNVQQAALSDGEYVITAAAVENLGQGAGAPAGQEREFGSKLLDRAMNEWQRA
jgi:hypothetical protein